MQEHITRSAACHLDNHMLCSAPAGAWPGSRAGSRQATGTAFTEARCSASMLSAHERATYWAAYVLGGLHLPLAILRGCPWRLTCCWPLAMPCNGTARMQWPTGPCRHVRNGTSWDIQELVPLCQALASLFRRTQRGKTCMQPRPPGCEDHPGVLASRIVIRCLYWLLIDWDCSVLTGAVCLQKCDVLRPLHT